MSARPWRVVLGGGLVAGALDIAYACAFWAIKRGTPPSRIFQSVAAGLLGDAAFQGGLAAAALGLALHFFIACSMAFAYWLVATRWAALWRRPAIFGTGYGLLMYLVMNYVVIPLSAAKPGASDPLWIGLTVLVHMVFIGVPIALAARTAIGAANPPPTPSRWDQGANVGR